MPRVLCAGHVNWDVTLRVSALPDPDGEAQIRSQRRAGGGSAANVAAALSGLNVETGVIGSVGDDHHGGLVRKELAALGLDLTGLRRVDGETTVKYLIVDAAGEVMVLGNEGVNEAFHATDSDTEAIRQASHLHVTGQQPETAATLARIAADAGTCVSVDPGRHVERDFSRAIELADVVFANEREAAELPDPTGGVVVQKHGDAGAEVSVGNEVFRHAGFDVEAVDTTGAGDAFAAGFIATLLDDGSYEHALVVANACGALAARDEGARACLSPATVDALVESGQLP